MFAEGDAVHTEGEPEQVYVLAGVADRVGPAEPRWILTYSRGSLEAQRVGARSGIQRLRQSMSLAVIKAVMARASWASR